MYLLVTLYITNLVNLPAAGVTTMLKKTAVLTLTLMSSAAMAQTASTLPIVGPLLTGIANALSALPTTPGSGVLGITALINGQDGSGIGQVLGLGLGGGKTPDVIGQQLNNRLVTPLLGLDGNGGILAVGAANGNNTTNAAANGLAAVAALSGNDNGNGGLAAVGAHNGNNTGNSGTAGVAALSGNNAGNGGLLGLGILNGNNSGNGAGLLGLGILNGNNTGNSAGAGVAALSGNNAGNGTIGLGILNGANSGNGQLLALAALSGSNSGSASQGLGIGILNAGDPLSITVAGGTPITLNNVASQVQTAVPVTTILPGIQIGGSKVTTSNPLLNVGVLAGDNAGNGGAIGLAVLSGKNTAQSTGLGVGLLNGDNSASGPLAVGALNGNNSGNGTFVGAGVLSGTNSGNSGGIGAGVLNASNSGNGGLIGAGVLNGQSTGTGDNSGNGGVIGAGVANSTTPTNNNNNPGGNNGTGNQSNDEDGNKLCSVGDQKKNRSGKSAKDACVPKVKVAQKN